jgi:hypothetical protein
MTCLVDLTTKKRDLVLELDRGVRELGVPSFSYE